VSGRSRRERDDDKVHVHTCGKLVEKLWRDSKEHGSGPRHRAHGERGTPDLAAETLRDLKLGLGGRRAQTLSPTETIASATVRKLVLLLRACVRMRW
jgi:hypothetical protein